MVLKMLILHFHRLGCQFSETDGKPCVQNALCYQRPSFGVGMSAPIEIPFQCSTRTQILQHALLRSGGSLSFSSLLIACDTLDGSMSLQDHPVNQVAGSSDAVTANQRCQVDERQENG